MHLLGKWGRCIPERFDNSQVGPKLRYVTFQAGINPLKGGKPAAFMVVTLLQSEVSACAAQSSLENSQGTVAGVLKDLGAMRNLSPKK